jgi:copper chaperone CopZ
MIKNKFKISGMHCTSCAFNIDGELEDTDGVEEANTNFAKAETEVKFDPEKVSVDKIIKLIKSVGYTASKC